MAQPTERADPHIRLQFFLTRLQNATLQEQDIYSIFSRGIRPLIAIVLYKEQQELHSTVCNPTTPAYYTIYICTMSSLFSIIVYYTWSWAHTCPEFMQFVKICASIVICALWVSNIKVVTVDQCKGFPQIRKKV